jgi:tRNA-dependent cyclodipeptide synthase
MEFRDIFNTTREDIEVGNWNPYLGISINNKYFTPEHIAAFASWGAQHCRDGFALLVVDILQRINNEVFDKANVEKAISKAFRQSDVILDACRQALATLPAADREKVVILEWPDIMDAAYCHNTRIVFDNFQNNEAFRNYIVDSVSGNLGSIINRLNEEKRLTLCNYVLYELSEFLCGFVHKGVHYDLCVYPGSIATLTRELLQQDFFQDIYGQFIFHGPLAHAEMYA